MSIQQITPPAKEPLTLDEVKEYLKVQTGEDDAVITRLIGAARKQVESLSGKLLIDQVWKIYLDDWPDNLRLDLAVSPVTSIIGVRVYDAQENWQLVSPDLYHADLAGTLQRLEIRAAALTLSPGVEIAGIEIEVLCGYGPTGDAVPEPLQQAMLLLIADWYSNRAASESFVARSQKLSRVRALTSPYWIARL